MNPPLPPPPAPLRAHVRRLTAGEQTCLASYARMAAIQFKLDGDTVPVLRRQFNVQLRDALALASLLDNATAVELTLKPLDHPAAPPR